VLGKIVEWDQISDGKQDTLRGIVEGCTDEGLIVTESKSSTLRKISWDGDREIVEIRLVRSPVLKPNPQIDTLKRSLKEILLPLLNVLDGNISFAEQVEALKTVRGRLEKL
jgi:hypothetical protein